MALDDVSVTGLSVERNTLTRIMKIVATKRATFPSEISNRTDLTPNEAGEVLRQLEDAEVLEMLTPGLKGNDERLLSRRYELRQRGTTGLGEFRKRRWYGLNSRYDWRLKVEEKPVFVDEYHDIIEENADDLRSPVEFAADQLGGTV